VRKKGRKQLAKRREKILGRHYGKSRAEAIRLWNDWLASHEKAIVGAESLNWIENFWNPVVPKRVVEHVSGVLLSSKMIGRALTWRDAHQRGYFQWAEKKEIKGLTAQAARLKYTDWTEAPIGSAGESWRWFKNKIPMTKSEFAAVAKRTHAAAFTIANTENELLVRSVKGLVDDAIKGDLTRGEFLKAAKEAWGALGVTRANPYHLETTLLTNIHSAANAARWSELQRDTEGLRQFYPYLQFVTVGDEAVCDICGPLDGQVYSRDDDFWDVYYPPLHHRCRCEVIEVSVLDVETEKIKPDTDYPDVQPAKGFDMPPAELMSAELLYSTIMQEINFPAGMNEYGRFANRPYKVRTRRF